MHARFQSWVAYVLLCGFGCCTELPPDVDLDAAAGVSHLNEPEASRLCEIRVGESSDSKVEDILGPTDRRDTTESTTLLYQYATGLTLSLLFREGVFVSATVYNGTYPACWTEDESQRSAHDAIGGDGGVGD